MSVADALVRPPAAGGRPRGPRRDNVASKPLFPPADPPETAAALAGLTTDTSECHECDGRAAGAPCSSAPVLAELVRFAETVEPPAPAEAAKPAPETLPSAPTPEAAAVRAVAAVLGCASESCVLQALPFQSFVVEAGLSKAALDRELALRFKAPGPRDNTALLSDRHIDATLQRWARAFPGLYACPFAMSDFDKTGEPFARLDLAAVRDGREPQDLGPGLGVVKRPCDAFACVVNTDSSRGPGVHWVAVFVDMRPAPGEPWGVEYYNSAGRPPFKAMVSWMERTRAHLAEYRAQKAGKAGGPPCEVVSVPVTDVDHQLGASECGLYALFYIRRRLEGTPTSWFMERKIRDKAMTRFRAHIFRGS